MMMMIAEDLMEDQEVVLVAEVRVMVALVVAVRAAEVVHQMDAPEIADHLHATQDAVVHQTDAAVLQTDAVVLRHQEEAASLQAMEDMAAKKAVLLQADDICIENIKEK